MLKAKSKTRYQTMVSIFQEKKSSAKISMMSMKDIYLEFLIYEARILTWKPATACNNLRN